MNKRLTNENGSTLVLSIFLILFISIIGLSLLRISANSLKQVDHERTNQAVYYVAEAGLTMAKEMIKKELKIKKQNADTNFLTEVNKNGEAYTDDIEAIKARYKLFLSTEFEKIDDSQKIYDLLDNKKATVNFEIDPIKYEVKITSVGQINNSSPRTLQQTITLNTDVENIYIGSEDTITPGSGGTGNTDPSKPTNPLEGYGALASGDIYISSNVIGNVGSLNGYINLNWGANIKGDISVTNNQITTPKNFSLENTVTGPIQVNMSDYTSKFPSDNFNAFNNLNYYNDEVFIDKDGNEHKAILDGNFKASGGAFKNYTLKLNSNNKFKDFTIESDNTIFLDIGDKTMNLYIENLNISQGDVKILGNGKLNIYTKQFEALKGGFNENGDSNQVTLFYNGSKPIIFFGETQFYGSIINNTADIKILGGAGVFGNIISEGTSIEIKGGVQSNGQYIIAPNANVDLNNGGTIKGTVLAKYISVQGGSTLHYTTPPSPLPPGVGPDTTITKPVIKLPPNNEIPTISEMIIVEI